MYIKDFDNWNKVKQRIQTEERSVNIRKGEIRWVSFARPALVIHVIGSHLALIIPVSTKVKEVAGYIPFTWSDKDNALCIHQMKVVSQKRILARLGKISENRLNEYKKIIASFYSF